MKRQCWDSECFPNYWLALFKNIDTGEFKKIELFNNEGNLHELVDTVNNSYLISYNGIDYDDIMINFIIANINTITNEDIYNFSKYIIFSKHEDNYYDKIRPYKYNKLYKTIDLMRMLFSKKLRVSLKSLQIMLKWHNVLECELSFDEPVSEYDIDMITGYVTMPICVVTHIKKLHELQET